MSRVIYSHYERRQTYASIRRILERFEQHDFTLARLSQLALPDGYPAGGDGGGHNKGGHSDPTGAAYSARVDGNDDASRAFAKLQDALLAFGEAEVFLRRALPPADAPKVETKRPPDIWCRSCARVKDGKGHQAIFEPRSTRKGGRQDLCRWCQDEWLGSHDDLARRTLPDVRLVMAHYAQQRLTVAKRREVLGLKVDDCRKRYIGDGGARARSAPESRAG